MSKKIVIFSGIGGGYDIFTCLPMYYTLKDKYDIVMCNLSFTSRENMNNCGIRQLIDGCYQVISGNYAEGIEYFPEYQLANALNTTVYAMTKYDTVKDIIAFYQAIGNIQIDQIHAIYMFDGGCDVLLSGKETGLGTPVEDIMHLKAVMVLPISISNKFVCALGMNADCGDGVIEHELIDRLDFLRKHGVIIHEEILELSGSGSESGSENATRYYYDIMRNCSPSNSIVNSFILSAIEGNTGKIVPEYIKTRIAVNTCVNISELTKTFIVCDANELCKHCYYMNLLSDVTTSDEFDEMIEKLYTSL